MLNIGCHLSSSKGYKHMGKEALSINANTFQYFSRNPRGSKAKAMDVADAKELDKILKDNSFAPLVVHAPYTFNPCSSDEGLREFAMNAMKEDLENLEHLPGNYYNIHPGSHVGQGADKGIELIADILNKVLHPQQNTMLLLETMSGKGSEVGSSFEEIKGIIDRLNVPEKVGVCMDTCHLYSAGYDVVNNLDGVLDEFDKIVGLNRLKAMHINDSMVPFNSRKDRHEVIGKGTIGLNGIENVINHPKIKHLPFILETPNELAGYAQEIKILRESYKY